VILPGKPIGTYQVGRGSLAAAWTTDRVGLRMSALQDLS
jgi:hypothetical protein